MENYDHRQLLHIAGMILVKEDGVFEGPRPQDAISKAMDYKGELAKSLKDVYETIELYLSQLSSEDKTFYQEKSGLYTGIPSLMSDEESERNMKIISAIANIEKDKGLLRKLVE